MHLCYIDEAGNGQTLDPVRPDAPPVLVVGGFTVPRAQVKSLTWAFLDVKKHTDRSCGTRTSSPR